MIEIKNLTVVYPDGTKAVDDLSFTVADGESVALIGANGAGKTSLLLTLAGVMNPKSGEVFVDGVRICKQNINEIRRRVGMVFQNPDDQLFMPLIYDDVAFGPRNFGLSETEVAAKVDAALKALSIEHLKDRSPLKLSGGEKRAAAIATVLSMEPTALLFDEPTAFLDPKSRRNLINVLSRLNQSKLIATHDLTFAEEACTRAVILKKGKIFADGEPRALLRDENLMEDCGLEAIR